jgi:hypothetical protein
VVTVSPKFVDETTSVSVWLQMARSSPPELMSRRRGVLTASLASPGALLVIVTVTPLVSWWATALAAPWDDPRGEVLIGLGRNL